MTTDPDERASAPTQQLSPDGSIDDAPTAAKPGDDGSWGWTRRQRFGLAMITVVFLGLLVVQAFRRPSRLDDPLIITGSGPTSLPVGIDPNTAEADSLSRIPGVSEAVAHALVEYREVHKTDTAEGVVFQNFEDLARVPKLRKKALDALRIALVFPGDATRPAPSPHGLTPPARVSATTEPDDEFAD